jgi:histidine triad (HIT) family protein
MEKAHQRRWRPRAAACRFSGTRMAPGMRSKRVHVEEGAMNEPHRHCIFCDLIQGAAEVSVCYEDAEALAFMDIQPVNPGHTLVAPRAHYESLSDIPRDLAMHLFDVAMTLAPAVKVAAGCDDMNIVVNSGHTAGQNVFHYHVHLIPRREGDNFDIALPFEGSRMPDRTFLDAIAARIIAELRDPARHAAPPASRGARRSQPVTATA